MAFSPTESLNVARRLFAYRFPEQDCAGASLQQLRGLEGMRVRKVYESLGTKYRVVWRGRKYTPSQVWVSDPINRALTIANVGLYSLCTSLILSLGFTPAVGFIHLDGPLPFVYDIADLIKYETSYTAAFQSVRDHVTPDSAQILSILAKQVVEANILAKFPDMVLKLFL